jgi:PPM family protein phosphatase
VVGFLGDISRFFRNFIRQKPGAEESVAPAIDTAPLSAEQLDSVTRPQLDFAPPQILVGTAQSAGMQRDHNEDTLFAMSTILADGINDLPFGIFIVADGMGGYQNGELASGAATRTLSDYLIHKFYLPYLTGKIENSDSLFEIMERGVQEAQRSVLRSAPGGGTTLTAALLIGEQVTFGHVGDSRAYLLYPDGRILAATQDHSLVRRLQDLGQIDEKEALIHPQRNVLYRALGQGEPFRPDINTHAIPRPGFMLLCSDGLWGVVTEDEIYRIVQQASNPSIACHQLVEAANAAGGPDNITAVLVQYLS